LLILCRSNLVARAKSLQALVDYCENTDTCRHHLITKHFGEKEVPECDYACDWHKDAKALQKAKNNGLQSEEWVSSQREMGRYDYGYDGYD
jgi:superfamily II DNA helicase RecQ